MARYDKDTVRQAAVGRWADLLASLGGVDAATLDGRHHPCPRCGGTDRFRALDDFAETGAVLCNQCFASKNGDGFAAVGWLTGQGFAESLAAVAERLGVQPRGSDKNDPAKSLEFLPWNGGLVPLFAQRRPGVTEESLLAAGARFAKYRRNHTVYALPVLGESLDVDNPAGWALLEATGGTLPKYDRHGKEVDRVKVKLTPGSKPGLIGLDGVEKIRTTGLARAVWKVEGVTDLLALWAAIPAEERERVAVVTNANGATERPKWMAAVLAGQDTRVLHDADEPGEAGAKVWAAEIARHGAPVRIVRLPYEVTGTQGKDIRDWLGEGRTWEDLERLAEKGELVAAPGGGEAESETECPMQELILRRLGLEVLYETREGAVRVFSVRLRKSTTFDRVPRLTKVDIVQAAGPVAMRVVSTDPDGQTSWSIDDVREAIAAVASTRRGRSCERGIGIWRGLDRQGAPTDAIVVAGDTEAALFNGERALKRVFDPRVDGLVLDYGDGDAQWYEFDDLERHVAAAEADPDWRRSVVDEAVRLFSRWRWRGEHDPQLVTGLVLATWLQTVWAWRPLVVVTGESNCGKSTLFETLAGKQGAFGLFGGLSLSGAKSSEAGIRQGIGNTGRVLLLDEFEKSKDRDTILQTLRASSRGDTVLKGTASHKGVQFRLQHVVWLAAIESGMSRQPDVNRFVHLQLLRAAPGSEGKLLAPSSYEAADLGLRLLAVAIVVGVAARRRAIDLKSHKVPGADPRAVETYAVPAAALGEAVGLSHEGSAALLESLMGGLDGDPLESDQELLLSAILDSRVQCDHGVRRSVRDLVESFEAGGAEWMSHQSAFRQHGLWLQDEPGGGPVLLVKKDVVLRELLRDTEWSRSRIDQVLLRLPGAERRAVKVSGSASRWVAVPLGGAERNSATERIPERNLLDEL